MHKRKIALIIGWSLILMSIIAGFSLGYAYPEFKQSDQIDLLKDNVQDNLGLYRNMLIGIILIIILDFLVSYTLYKYFKEENRNISLMSGVLRVAYTFIFGIATFYMSKNLNITELTNQTVNTNLRLFQSIWSGGLIIFGLHLILIAMLMKWHKRIPKILWYFTWIAGVSYIIVHLLKSVSTNSELANTLEMILALPMAIGEIGLAIWLLLKGGKESKFEKKPIANKS
ncbi:MAG: DUF4386 domain-containing protein [Saprospiraceae bacterium]|nr:DUF4386 domain-containing protein [Saprospiraceae bacterium]